MAAEQPGDSGTPDGPSGAAGGHRRPAGLAWIQWAKLRRYCQSRETGRREHLRDEKREGGRTAGTGLPFR